MTRKDLTKANKKNLLYTGAKIGLTAKQYIAENKKAWGSEGDKIFEENLAKGRESFDVDEMRKTVREGIVKALNHRKDIISKAPGMINEMLDESFDTCTEVSVANSFFHRNEAGDEWWNGVATLKNSATGKTKKRNIEVMYGSNGTIVVTLKDSRP